MKILWYNHKCIIRSSYLEMTNQSTITFGAERTSGSRSVLKAVRVATFPVASRGHFAPQLRSFRVELCSDGKIGRLVAAGSWHFPNPPLNDWRVSEIVSEMKRIECRLLHLEIIKDAFTETPFIHGLSCFAKTNTFTKLLPRPHIYLSWYGCPQQWIPAISTSTRSHPQRLWRTPIPLPEKVPESSNSNLTSSIQTI